MPITPGECGFTVIAGITLPTCPSFTAKDCILVNKVYDQCFTEDLVTSQVPALVACPRVVIPIGSTISCIPIPGSQTCTFAGTVAVTPPLTPFFEEVLVFNSFQVSAPIFFNGVTICAPTLTLTGAARAILWAPPGTTVTCDILAFGDCTCFLLTGPTGGFVISCVGKICKEIQVTAPVKLLVPSYGFCEAPTCTHITQPGFACLPQPLFPPQRTQSPPTVSIFVIDTPPLPGVPVSIFRLINGVSTLIATAITDTNGTATFPTIGGIEGALDTITFPFGAHTKTVSFPVPTEFTDVAGVAHDSATASSVVFTQAEAGRPLFNVEINSFGLGVTFGVPLTIDP